MCGLACTWKYVVVDVFNVVFFVNGSKLLGMYSA